MAECSHRRVTTAVLQRGLSLLVEAEMTPAKDQRAEFCDTFVDVAWIFERRRALGLMSVK